MTKNRQSSSHISDQTIRLCTSGESVSSLLARDPNLRPSDAWEKLYGDAARKSEDATPSEPDQEMENGREGIRTDLERAAKCGNWGPTKPSDLFLKIYHDALCALDQDPGQAVVSPSLMGSYGTAPLTIISVLPDIVRHMSNVIVRAKEEVFLATNYWQNSVASKYITEAIRELDRRAGERGARVVVKVLYDRGSPRQLYQPHYIVSEKVSTGKDVNLPSANEIPNIDLEVMNYHTPLMGTFHAKYVVVDRKIALLQSNNIQDNDNLEMMVHLEGPIVDSVYDMALISWHKRLDPPSPSQTAAADGDGEQRARSDTTNGGSMRDPRSDRGRVEPVRDDKKSILAHEVNGEGHRNGTDKALPSQSPGQKPGLLPEHTADDAHYDRDMVGEVARAQASLAPKPGETHLQAVTRLLNHTLNEGLPGDPEAPECPPGEFMTPYLPHQTNTPYPMALVNRAPYGPPTHRSLSNPQNAAWLSALRNAQKNVYIVSPTLNASPLIPAIIEACERGVDVHCYICLSYNDAGELLPRQGGHNEGVAAHLHRALAPPARARLHYRWYVAKDQTRPITQAARQRSSHIKLLVADGAVAVQGSGNQDTQSWFHSQEANLLVDSPGLCREWLAGLERNQNTGLFGGVGEGDGVWRDETGREAEGAMGVRAGRVRGWARGVKGAVERVRGTGGF